MYDIIVFGSDISALTAASVSASNGLRTCLLREDAWLPSYVQAHSSFETDPLPWTGFHAGGVADVLLDKLGISLPVRFSDPSCQIVLPRHRVSLSRDHAQTAADMTRAFPGFSREITTLINTLQKGHPLFFDDSGYALRSISSFSERLREAVTLPRRALRLSSFRRTIEGLSHNPALSTLFGVHEAFFSHFYSSAIPPLPKGTEALGMSQMGVAEIMGGNKVLYEELLRCVTARGGRHLSECNAVNCSLNNTIEITVSSPAGEQTVTAPRLILSCPSPLFDHIAVHNPSFAKKAHSLSEKAAWWYPFTVHLAVRERSLPEQMGRHVLIVDDMGQSLLNGNAVHLYTAKTGTDNGDVTLHITALVDFLPHAGNSDRLHVITRSMHDTVSAVLPFLDEGTIYCDFASSIAHAHMTAHTRAPRFPISGTGARGTLISQKTPFKNIFLTGPAIIPCCGFEGDIASGMHAAYLAGGIY